MSALLSNQVYNWHLEISSKCPLKCPRCTRTEYPGTFPVTQLGLEFIKKLFTPEFLKASVHRITLSGGVGDAIYNTELPEIFEYLKSHNPKLQIVLITNGSYKDRGWWQNLLKHANGYDEIIFSIDGWDHASNNLYRVNSDWESIMVGVEEAVKSKAYVRWSTIIFKFNEDKIEDIKKLASDLRVDSFHAVLSERFGELYKNKTSGIDPLEPSDHFKSNIPRTQRFKENFKHHPQKRAAALEAFERIDKMFKETYAQTLQEYGDHYILPTCKFGFRGIYVDVEGILYPCSWVSHQFDVKGSLVNPKRELHYKDGFVKYKDQLNLHKRSLDEVLKDPIWKELDDGWKSEDNAFIICERKCLAKNSSKEDLGSKKLEELVG